MEKSEVRGQAYIGSLSDTPSVLQVWLTIPGLNMMILKMFDVVYVAAFIK